MKKRPEVKMQVSGRAYTALQFVATRWTNGLNVTNVLKNNSAVEYEGISIASTVVLVT